MPSADRSRIYAVIWRWHFYAGLFVIPFVLLLAVTGAAYLFKPQVERWEEHTFHSLPMGNIVAPHKQVEAAMAGFPGARFSNYRLPEKSGDAAKIHLAMPDGRSMLDVFVSPEGKVLGSMAPDTRLMEWVKRIHGQLLLGKRGSWIVELAASWAIVLVLTGLYLWWPRGRTISGVLLPRLKRGKRIFWRDMHAVTGFWIAGFLLVLLFTGLPWTSLWGSAFNTIRTEMGWVKGPQDWTLGGEAPSAPANIHAAHDHAAMMQSGPLSQATPAQIGIDEIVDKARQENLAFPAIVTPPGAPGRFGAPGVMGWNIRSDSVSPHLRTSITYDVQTGQETSRQNFADGHILDRIIGYGIAWHEGQLFGWISQLIGLLTAIGLIIMAISGFILWRRRKPVGMLGAPPSLSIPVRMRGVTVILLLLAVFLPLLAASLILSWLFERLILPHFPRLARWLGISTHAVHS